MVNLIAKFELESWFYNSSPVFYLLFQKAHEWKYNQGKGFVKYWVMGVLVTRIKVLGVSTKYIVLKSW